VTTADMQALTGPGPSFQPWRPAVTNCQAMTEGDTYPAGTAIMITASGGGTVGLKLSSGNSITVNPVVGDNIYPFAVVEWTTGTATVTTAYNLNVP